LAKRGCQAAAEDIGRCAYPIFKQPGRLVGETIGIAGEHTTGNQLAAGLSEVFGEPVRYQPVPAEVFRGLPFPGPTSPRTCSNSLPRTTATAAAAMSPSPGH
jgi:uncharacterized protein YbjT (DUF2867 family)